MTTLTRQWPAVLTAAAGLLAAPACVPAAGTATATTPVPGDVTASVTASTTAAPVPVPVVGVPPVAADLTAPAYDRDLYPHWSTADGCTTRETVLIEHGTDVAVDADCAPLSGRWTSRYDGVTVTNPAELEIDHLVPLADAHRSGGARWTRDQRRAFANDRANLVPVTIAAHDPKGDQDPATWLPTRDVCWYVTTWAGVKTRHGLTADAAEAAAIEQLLADCPAGGGAR